MAELLKLNKFWLNKAIILTVILVLAFNIPLSEAVAILDYSDIASLINTKPDFGKNLLMITGGDSLMSGNASLNQSKTITIVLTAYSSTPDQTDDTPFITASNTHVRDGTVAANFLAFGTKIKIPSLFGDKIFTVEDRMARKNPDKIDIWFPERHLAKKFGVKEAEVVVFQ